ncbi:glycoside hydrolase family 113 [Enterobacter intestinihominis]|uniref:glycoside hydrolase family 113 n=1 Tax=Enterobacter intestinihominis TaxID=3133180 RepID=UPI003B43C708
MKLSRRTLFRMMAGTAALAIAGCNSSSAGQKKGNTMKYKGVVYDVGLKFVAENPYSVVDFDPELVRYDINAIAGQLHANAIRIEGEEISRLTTAARIAHEAGLTVFFNPWKMNVPVSELPAYFKQAAREAEILRKEGVDIVFVCGCEITMFNEGIFPGNTVIERATWMGSQSGHDAEQNAYALYSEASVRLNVLLSSVVTEVRAEYQGPLTYSAGSWESVNWDLFDITGVDYYRNGETAEEYVAGIERYRSKKPFVVMEVGCCAYEGAAQKGAGGFMILEGVNPDGSGKFAGGTPPLRSEQEQADYAGEQLELLSSAGVDGVFIYVFSFPTYRAGEGAKDLDMLSFSLVKTFPEDDPRSQQMPPWAPKKAFHRIARFYQTH